MATQETSIPGYAVAMAPATDRSAFIRRTYIHLALAILAFAGIEWVLFGPLFHVTGPLALKMLELEHGWLVVLGAFMVVGWVADRWARSAASRAMQYLGLLLYVVAEAIIFLPLLYYAMVLTSPELIPTAAILTLGLFAGLTGTVFITRKDFSFLRGALMMGAFIAMGLIACAIMFGFSLGSVFAVAMIALAGGYVLYYTSGVMKHYRTDQHVAAALALFAAIALMFWYVLLLLIKIYKR
jgi:FtsH-binding integral membrane protein